MPKIKKKELKEMGIEELNNISKELKKELMKENSQIVIGTTPKSPGYVNDIKKNIARINALIHTKNMKNLVNKKEENKQNKIQQKEE